MRMPYQNELYHYGISGMKWGIRRFQNPDGTLTAAGRRRYGTVENLERGMTKKQAAEHEAEKQAAINSGKTAQVQKFSSELTKEEMAYAVQRIKDEQTLSDLRAKDVAAGQQSVKAIIDAGGQLKSAGETVKNLYNLVAQANNAFNKDHKMPIIGAEDNNRKGNKPLSADDQTKLFNLEQSKKKAAREAEVEELIRTKDLDWFKKHSSEFTKEELGKAIGRQELFESEKWKGNDKSSKTGPIETAITGSSNDKSKSGNGNKTNSGANFVKDNYGGEKPFSAFKTSPHSTSGGKVDFDGLVFEKVFPSRESAYKAYIDEHPNSKLTESEFMSWFKEN